MVRRLLLVSAMASVLTVSALVGASEAGGAFGKFDAALPSCDNITAVKVSGTAATHHYAFVLVCDYANLSVEAAYGSGRASEKIKGEGFTFTSVWDCADDPWSAPGKVGCSNPKT